MLEPQRAVRGASQGARSEDWRDTLRDIGDEGSGISGGRRGDCGPRQTTSLDGAYIPSLRAEVAAHAKRRRSTGP